MKKKFVCTVCGYVYEGEEAPDQCPICKVSKDRFKEVVEEPEAKTKKKFVCAVCGYEYVGDAAPEQCPVCKAPKEKFKEVSDELSVSQSADLKDLAGKWTVDMTHARIGFEIKHCGLSFVSGHFADFEVVIEAQGEQLKDTDILVTIQASSVNTGVEARDHHLRTADFFDVDKYPTIVFRSTKVVAENDREGKIEGELTLVGVTKPVVLDATLIDCMPSPMTRQLTAGFRLKGVLKRSDFGFGPKYVPAIIGEEVNLIIDAEFTPAK